MTSLRRLVLAEVSRVRRSRQVSRSIEAFELTRAVKRRLSGVDKRTGL
jgi:hypothetical protein